jgi:CubicO group peptidase (beta-lactamase class C family)
VTPFPNLAAAVLQPYIDRGEIAGAVTLVASRDGILDVGAAGFADVAAGAPMQPDTLFWIASMTKPMTATALMMLVDEGKVNVDDPVEKHLPEFKNPMVIAEADAEHVLLRAPKHPMTVGHVLSHTSGLPFGVLTEHPTRDPLPLWATVRSYAMTPLLSEPGVRYEYSNAGTNTAGRIIEVTTGMAYEDFMQTRLFDPLGMSDTTFWPDEEQVSRLAKAYEAGGAGLKEVRISQLQYPLTDRVRRFPVPAGGLFSTAADCAKFCRMILNAGSVDGRRYVSEAAVRQMTRRQTAAGIKESYGFGWSVSADGNQCSHGGACATNMTVDTKRGLTTVFLVQLTGSDRVEEARAAFQAAAEKMV